MALGTRQAATCTLVEWRATGHNENLRTSMNLTSSGVPVESPLTLDRSEVHLWRLNLETVGGAVEHWGPVLSGDEQTRAARFHHDKDRKCFMATRSALRQILGAYLKADPKLLSFTYSEKEKPSLAGPEAASGIEFNVSHSGTLALLAFARGRMVGVDVEQTNRNIDTAAIATRFFSEAEQKQLASLPADQRTDAFFLCWTRKEAYIKATGKGLSLPLRQFDVSMTPRDQNALLATRPDAVERNRWSMRDIPVPAGYAAALCVSGTDWRLVDSGAQEYGA
jgi:4'-phosphopantetheinyl transferase